MNTNSEQELLALAKREAEILHQLNSVEGGIQSCLAQISEAGIFEEYKEIHCRYSALAQSGSLEALKRAIYIQWCLESEPSFCSGISSLEQSEVTRVLGLAEGLCESGDYDSEWSWMVPYYHETTEWLIPTQKSRFLRRNKPAFPFLDKWCRANQKGGSLSVPASSEFDMRGQMGAYWNSFGREYVAT